MKTKLLLLLLFSSFYLQAQVVGTPFMVTPTIAMPLDLVSDTPSFAFSTRKLKATYSGFALRVRKSTDNSEVNVAFDTNNQVSNGSAVTYVVAGTSGQAVGATTTLGSYIGTAQLYVTTWYDQSGNGRNATQTTATAQPELLIRAQNDQATLKYLGTHVLYVSATPSQILGTTTGGVQGIIGTLQFTCKLTTLPANTFPYSIGFSDSVQRRFMLHLNWSDNNTYFDAGEQCCVTNRSFANGTSMNKWKQYTFQRQDVNKIARVSGANGMNNLAGGSAATASGITAFGIGGVFDVRGSRSGLYGELGDFILFDKALTQVQFSNIENNQMAFWNCY